MGQQLIEAIANIDEDEALRLVREALEKGEDPEGILGDCQAAMDLVGSRYEHGEYYLPELIMSGEVLGKIAEVVKPRLGVGTTGGRARNGKIVLGTVRGDIHDIGKNIVSFMLDINGFEVHDLGVDVPEERFVEAVRTERPQVVALSGFLTLAYDSMKSTVEALDKAGLRSSVRVMIGGGQMTDLVRDYVGADALGLDAVAAVRLAKEWLGVA
jgi:methanogenic corrinoid protein MtbC1